jgi:hydroxymethylbilane synthase
MTKVLKIGSRGSQLALWQSRYIQGRLKELGVKSEIEIIRTTGDKITDVPLAKVGGKGLFTKEIEEALLDGRVDLAVHSLKDLPTELPEGLALAATPEREMAFDALVGRKLEELDHGAVVGTSSLRRAAQLKSLRPDVVIRDIRGNLDTRLRKLDEGQYQAILLAGAGLRRLGWGDRIAEVLDPGRMCPAVGQGALGIETRAGGEAFEIVSRLDHGPTRAAVTAERAALASLGGGCQVPLGAHAEVDGDRLRIRAVVADPDGTLVISASVEGKADDAAAIGAEAAKRLLEQGARAILARVYGEAPPLAGQRVLVTRAATQAGSLTVQLRCLGAEVVELPVIGVQPLAFDPPRGHYDWVLFTSANAVSCFLDRAGMPEGAKAAAIGPATDGALRAHGVDVALVAETSTGEGLAAAFEGIPIEGNRLLIPRAETAREALESALTGRGAEVVILPVYRNVVPEGLAEAAKALFDGPSRPDWVTLMSPSAVKNMLAAVGLSTLSQARIASIGPVTSEAARRHGLEVAAEAAESTAEALGRAMVEKV